MTRTVPRASWRRLVMVLNVVLIAGVAIIGITHVRAQDADERAVVPDASGLAATTAPSAPTTTAPVAPVTPAPSSGAPAGTVVAHAPKMKATMRSDFEAGDPWPYGADFRETGRLTWALGVVDHVMTHGAPQGPNAVSWLQKWMRTDVRTIGARVLFAPNHSGSAAITAWHTSVLDTSGVHQPRTGMRLVARPGSWQLVALTDKGQSVIAAGTYEKDGRAARFDLVRRDSTIWLTDPEGTVIRVDDPRIGSLSGPWASWELRDDTADRRPAGFQEIWAG